MRALTAWRRSVKRWAITAYCGGGLSGYAVTALFAALRLKRL